MYAVVFDIQNSGTVLQTVIFKGDRHQEVSFSQNCWMGLSLVRECCALSSLPTEWGRWAQVRDVNSADCGSESNMYMSPFSQIPSQINESATSHFVMFHL